VWVSGVKEKDLWRRGEGKGSRLTYPASRFDPDRIMRSCLHRGCEMRGTRRRVRKGPSNSHVIYSA